MHMMLDLETLALDPRAIVFQIGAVVFDMQTGEMPVQMRLDIDILPQIMRGRIFDPNTQKWWMTQPRESWDRWPKDVKTVTSALEDVNSLFDSGHITHVWANSPSFDGVILRSLAKDFATELRWDFRSEMDVRTLKSMSLIAQLPPADPFETTHDALKDCIDQVHKVRHYWSHIIGMEQQDIVTPS